jgi:Putative auto-transporter adhesin, head GIN domain
MKHKLSLYLLAFIFVSSTACAQTKETRTVDTFTKIAFRVAGKLYLKQGSPQKVELEGKKDVLDKIETEVSNGKLTIGTENKWNNWHWRNDDDIIVYITVKDIEGLSVSGSGDLIAQTILTGNNFDLAVSGSGSLQAEIEATGDLGADVSGSGNIDLKGKFKNFESHISGSGDVLLSAVIAERADFGLSGSGKIKASGTAQSVKATISGSGKVLAANLEADKCNVRISGSGDVEINVKSELDANISGSGSVSYKGNPSHVNSHSSGSGSISKL